MSTSCAPIWFGITPIIHISAIEMDFSWPKFHIYIIYTCITISNFNMPIFKKFESISSSLEFDGMSNFIRNPFLCYFKSLSNMMMTIVTMTELMIFRVLWNCDATKCIFMITHHDKVFSNMINILLIIRCCFRKYGPDSLLWYVIILFIYGQVSLFT